MHCLWCGDVTFNERRVIDEAPHFTLPNDYRSLFPLLRLTLSHTHTVAHTSVWSTPATALEKENHSHLGSFHYPHHLILTVISAQRRGDNHREAEGFCLICPESETHSHPQWPFVATVSAGQTMPGHIHRSCLPDTDTVGASDEWDIAPHLIQSFLISRANNTDDWKGWIQLSDGTQATQFTWTLKNIYISNVQESKGFIKIG